MSENRIYEELIIEELLEIVDKPSIKYKIIDKVGSGATAILYKVEEITTHDLFWLRVFNPKKANWMDDIDARKKRFMNPDNGDDEYLNPKLLTVKKGDQAYPAWVRNCDNYISLKAYFDTQKASIGSMKFLFIISQLLEYVNKLRNDKIIHFDIKPDNILVDQYTGSISKVIDFDSAIKYFGEPDDIKKYESYIPYISYSSDNIRSNAKSMHFCYDVWCVADIVRQAIENNYVELYPTNKAEEFVVFSKDTERCCQNNVTYEQCKRKADDYTIMIKQYLDSFVDISWEAIRNIPHYDRNVDGFNFIQYLNANDKNFYSSLESMYGCTDDVSPNMIACDFNKERIYILEAIYQKYKGSNTIIPAICDIKMESRTGKYASVSGETDIKNEISFAITGRNNLYNEIRAFLRNQIDSGKRLLLLVNIRVYHDLLIKKIKNVLDDLYEDGSCGVVFTYVVCCTNHVSRKWNEYNRFSERKMPTQYLYNYYKNNEISSYADRSFYHSMKFGQGIIEPKKLITSQMGVVDNTKINVFASLLFKCFGFNNSFEESAQIYIDDIASPLTLADIIHVSERTGIITVDEISEYQDYIRIRITNPELANSIMLDGYLGNVIDNSLYELLTRKVLSESDQKEIISYLNRHKNCWNELIDQCRLIFPYNTLYAEIQKKSPFDNLKCLLSSKNNNIELSDTDTILTINICNILKTEHTDILEKWLSETGCFPMFNDKVSVVESDTLQLTHKYREKKKWFSKGYVTGVAFVSGCVAIVLASIIALLGNMEKQDLFPERFDALNDCYTYSESIFSLRMDLANNSMKRLDDYGYYFVDDTGNIIRATCLEKSSDDNLRCIQLFIDTEDVDVSQTLHIVKVGHNETNYAECDLYVVPDSYRIEAEVTQLPIYCEVTDDGLYFNKTDLLEFEFLIKTADYNDQVVLECVAPDIKDSIHLVVTDCDTYDNSDVDRQIIDPKEIELIEADNKSSFRYRVAFSKSEISDLVYSGLFDDYVANAFIVVDSSDYEVRSDRGYNIFRGLVSNPISLLRSNITTDTTLLPQIEYYTESASNAKNIVFCPRVYGTESEWKANYSFIDVKDNTFSSIVAEGVAWENSFINIEHEFFTLQDATFSVESDNRIEMNVRLCDSNGKILQQDIIADCTRNGEDDRPPEISQHSVEIGKDMKITLVVSDNYPLADIIEINDSKDISDYISAVGVTYSDVKISSRYVVNEDRLGDVRRQYLYITLCDVEFDNITFDEHGYHYGDYSVMLEEGFITDDASNPAPAINIGYIPRHYNALNGEEHIIDVLYPLDVRAVNLKSGHIGVYGSDGQVDINEYYDIVLSENAIKADYITINGGTAVLNNGYAIGSSKLLLAGDIVISCYEYDKERQAMQLELIYPNNVDTISLGAEDICLYTKAGEPIGCNIHGDYGVHDRILLTIRDLKEIPYSISIADNTGFVSGDNGGAIRGGKTNFYR